MNLLITGGAGFIGSRFAEMLVSGSIPNSYSSITVVDKLTSCTQTVWEHRTS